MPQRVLSESEFNAIRDSVLKALPSGLKEEDFNRIAPTMLAQAVGEAESSPAPVSGAAAWRFVSNAAEMLNPISLAQGLYQAARHPIDTATGIVEQQIGQGRQAIDIATHAQGIGDLSRAAGHAAAAVVPMLGPAAAEAGEQIASGDVAGGLGKTAGIIAPLEAGRIAAGIGKAKGLIPETEREIVRRRLDQMASSRVADVMAPKVGANKVRFGQAAEKVAPAVAKDLAADGAPWTREGLQARIGEKLAEAEAELDAAADARLPSKQVPTHLILQKLDQRIGELRAEPVHASRPIPSVTGGAVRQVPVDPGVHYALTWIKDEMESFPFVKKTFTEIPRGKGNAMEVTAGAAGAPIYRAIVGDEGREVIKASRADVIRAVNDALQGKTEGRLHQLVLGVAEDMANNKPAIFKKLNTPGPVWQSPPEQYMLSMKGKPAEMPAREGRPIGEAVEPAARADELTTLRQIRDEVARLGPIAPYESVRRIRQAWDQVAKIKYLPSSTQDAMKSLGTQTAAMKGTGAMRDALALVDPQTAAANAKYSLYRQAHDVLQATAEVERTRPKVGRQIMARLTGTVAGGQAAGMPGAAAGYLLAPVVDAAVSSGLTTQLKTAALLTKLSQAIRRGDIGHVQSVTAELKRLGAQSAVLTGRSTNSDQTAPTAALP